jgi:hypothetical protein
MIQRIFKTILVIQATLKKSCTELFRYFTAPFIVLLVFREIAKANRRLRIIWCLKRRGRPPVSEEIRNLVIELKKLNSTWAAPGLPALRRTVAPKWQGRAIS